MQQTFVLQVRNPEKVDPQKNLTIVKCDVFSAQVIRENNEIMINSFHMDHLNQFNHCRALKTCFAGKTQLFPCLDSLKQKRFLKLNSDDIKCFSSGGDRLFLNHPGHSGCNEKSEGGAFFFFNK